VPQTFKRENIVFSTNDAGTTGYSTCKRINLDLYLILHTKVNSEWVKGLNIRAKIINLFKENQKIFA
jgi:hypothetical protein